MRYIKFRVGNINEKEMVCMDDLERICIHDDGSWSVDDFDGNHLVRDTLDDKRLKGTGREIFYT